MMCESPDAVHSLAPLVTAASPGAALHRLIEGELSAGAFWSCMLCLAALSLTALVCAAWTLRQQTRPSQSAPAPPCDDCRRMGAWARVAVGVGLALLAAVLYRGVFDGRLFSDDWLLVGRQSVDRTIGYFTGQFMFGLSDVGGYFRPLVRVFLALESWALGESPASMHTMHFVLFMAVVCALWLLARRLFRCERTATLAAALFLCYPTHPHAVYWLSGVGDLLSMLLIVVALRVYMRQRRVASVVGLLGFLALGFAGFLTKETAAILPLLVVCLELWLGRREEERAVHRWDALACLLALEGVYLAWIASASWLTRRSGEHFGILFNPITLGLPWLGMAVFPLFVAVGVGRAAWRRDRTLALTFALTVVVSAPVMFADYSFADGSGLWLFFLPAGFLALWLAAVARALAGTDWRPSVRTYATLAAAAAVLIAYAVAQQSRIALWKQAEAKAETFLEALARALPDPQEGVVLLFERRHPRWQFLPPVYEFQGVPMFHAFGPVIPSIYDLPGPVYVDHAPRVGAEAEPPGGRSYVLIEDYHRVRRVRPVRSRFVHAGFIETTPGGPEKDHPRPTRSLVSEALLPPGCHATLLLNVRAEDMTTIRIHVDEGAGFGTTPHAIETIRPSERAYEQTFPLGMLDACRALMIASPE